MEDRMSRRAGSNGLTRATLLISTVLILGVCLGCSENEDHGSAERRALAQAEVDLLMAANRRFDAHHGNRHHCPEPEQLTLTVKRVRVLDSGWVWHETSDVVQDIELFPPRSLANALGLASLPAGTYRGALLYVAGAEVELNGDASRVIVRHHRVWLDGDFSVAPGQPIVFVPDTDDAVRCLRDIECEKKAGHDLDDHDRGLGHPSWRDREHDSTRHGRGHDRHRSRGNGWSRFGREQHGFHGSHGSHSFGHGHAKAHRCGCETKLVWILRPVIDVLGQDADFDQDGVADLLDNCPADANPDQADGDGDGLGDACDDCEGGDDADFDGVCDAVDNCVDVANPAQRDMDGDGLGDRCDSQSCFSPVQIPDQQQARLLAFAQPDVSALIEGHQVEVLLLQVECTRYGPDAGRHIDVLVYDYDANTTIDARVSLDSLSAPSVRIEEGQPAVQSPNEALGAIAIADADPDVQALLGGIDTSLTTVMGPGRSGIVECETQRCLEVLYHSRNDTGAEFSPPEAYGDGSIGWQGIAIEFGVTVNLVTGNVVRIREF